MLRAFLLACALVAAAPAAAVGPEWSELHTDPDFRMARDRIDARDWPDAIRRFSALTATHPNEPEVWTWLGFASRQLDDWPNAAKYYERALTLDPDFLPAIEYQGRGYVQIGDLAAAARNLARLESLCGACEQYRGLSEAIRIARRSGPQP